MLRRWWRSKHTALEEAPDSGDDPDDAPRWVRAGEVVELRRHQPENRVAFQRWYADPEIAGLLRHDQEPLSAVQSRGYFDSFILPLSARGSCWAIHECLTGRLLGTTAITDIVSRRGNGVSGLFRIVIGEKDVWGKGYGTEATKLVLQEAFDEMDLEEVRLEVFRHNPRAISAYHRVGFRVTGEHVEWLNRRRIELHVLEMAISAGAFWDLYDDSDDAEDDEDWTDSGDDTVEDLDGQNQGDLLGGDLVIPEAAASGDSEAAEPAASGDYLASQPDRGEVVKSDP